MDYPRCSIPTINPIQSFIGSSHVRVISDIQYITIAAGQTDYCDYTSFESGLIYSIYSVCVAQEDNAPFLSYLKYNGEFVCLNRSVGVSQWQNLSGLPFLLLDGSRVEQSMKNLDSVSRTYAVTFSFLVVPRQAGWGVPPNTYFVVDDYTPEVGVAANFTNLVLNEPDSYIWDFGDGSAYSTTKNPSKAYSAAGTYTVTLYATNDWGTTQYSTSIVVHT